jgi:hypothetical protein
MAPLNEQDRSQLLEVIRSAHLRSEDRWRGALETSRATDLVLPLMLWHLRHLRRLHLDYYFHAPSEFLVLSFRTGRLPEGHEVAFYGLVIANVTRATRLSRFYQISVPSPPSAPSVHLGFAPLFEICAQVVRSTIHSIDNHSLPSCPRSVPCLALLFPFIGRVTATRSSPMITMQCRDVDMRRYSLG